MNKLGNLISRKNGIICLSLATNIYKRESSVTYDWIKFADTNRIAEYTNLRIHEFTNQRTGGTWGSRTINVLPILIALLAVMVPP